MPIRLWTDKNSCQYTYEYDPVVGITLPLERHRRWYRTTTRTGLGRALLPKTRPRCRHYTAARTTRRWHRTATRIDKLRTDVPVELRPRADMPASLNLSLAPYCYYNRPLLPCLQLINPYYFISSWLTLTTLDRKSVV